MYRGGYQEEVTRHQERRDQDRGIRTRKEGAENLVMRGERISEALTFGEKDPASGRESTRSGGVRAGEHKIRRRQNAKVVHQTQSGRTGRRGPCPDGVRTNGAK